MFLKVSFISERWCGILPVILFTLLLSGCAIFETGDRERTPRQPSVPDLANQFNPPGQVIAGLSIGSITLHKSGSRTSAPIIELGSDDVLKLQFDHIGSESRQFRVRFTHHNPDWSRSSLNQEQYQDGFDSVPISGGDLSQNSRPYYRTFSYEFPNREIRFRKSGNYMMRVEDGLTGNLVFTIPFFVTENEGSIRSQTEELIVPRQQLRTAHRPVSLYRLTDEVDQPQFDLRFHYVQNRFWGRYRVADETDFSDPNEVQFELSRQRAFTGDYEFRVLNLDGLTQLNPQIAEADPAQNPPVVILEDEAQAFPLFFADDRRGRVSQPSTDPTRGYADVLFRFDPEADIPKGAEIYLTGDFNNWSIREGQRLSFNERIERWETSAIIKEGLYHYKYVLVYENRIDDLTFDRLFGTGVQEYHAFVYMRDNQNFYHRLLQVNQFFK